MKVKVSRTKSKFGSPKILRSIKNEALRILKMNGVEGELSITIAGDQLMKRLNRDYRGKNTTTDVLSFRINEGGILGDVYISYPRALKQARLYDCSLSEELKRLAAHGILHVLGYRHKEMGKYGS